MPIIAHLGNGLPALAGGINYAHWLAILAIAGIVLISYIGLFFLLYFLMSLPMRRQEHARMFLDLIESGLEEGTSVEETVVQYSRSRDPALGHRFHLLAAHLENGLRLSGALKRVPELLPPQLVTMLAVGEQVGDLRKVLPACRRTVTGSSSKLTGAVNYLFLLLFCVKPSSGLVLLVIPRFRDIAMDLTTHGLPPIINFLYEHSHLVGLIQLLLMGLVYLAALVYVWGPRVIPRLAPVLKPLSDRLNDRFPWRRKRLQRDFSAMLAVLLDAEVPEEQAVTLAAQCTDNEKFVRRGVLVADRLHEGMPLTDAVQAMDDTGEFRWRLANSAHGRGGFLAALTGWHDALDAKAYQLEQAASQVLTTAVVILNGCIVGLLAVGVFQMLTGVVWELSLW